MGRWVVGQPNPAMSTPQAPSSSGPSSTLWLILGALALAALAALWWSRQADENADAGDEVAAADEDPNAPRTRSATPSADSPTLAPIWTRASGQVTAAEGEALAGALVTLAPLDRDGGEPRTTRTDASGDWSLTELPAGRYTLSATAPGYLAAVRPELVVRAEADNSGLDLELAPGGATLSGVVSDKTGGIIEGALVQVTPSSGIIRMRERESYFTVTDEDGRYAVQVPSGRQRVRASHSDYTSESVVLEFGGEDRTQDFALVPTAVIEGVVVREADGAPVPFAEVTWSKQRTMVLPGGDRVSTIERGGKVTASAEGRFRISGLPPGTIELAARASQLASFSPTQIPVGIAERVSEVELRLAAASDVEGRVVARADGHSIADASVELMSQVGPGPRVEADDEGRFRLLGVLPGDYRLAASAEGWTTPDGPAPAVHVGGEAPAEVVVELVESLTIRGRVVPPTRAEVAIELDPDNLRMAGGMMTLSLAESTHASAETGAFELGPLEPGHYTLQARTADGRGGKLEVDVGEDGLDGVVIELEQRASLVGHVEDFSGKLIDDVSVRARKRRPSRSISVVVNGRELTAQSAPTTTEGQFELAGLEGGAWFVEVVDGQGQPLALDSGDRLELDLREGETRELVVRVEPRDGRIAGVVRDAEGRPVVDAWVSAAFVPELAKPEPEPDDEDGGGESRTEMRMMVVSDDGGTLATMAPVLTDADGRFAFDKLRRGNYTLTAELDGGASKATLDEVQPDAEVTLELAPLGTLAGRVSADGKSIDCVARIAGPSERTVKVRDGSFEVERLEPGRYTVEARTPDGATSAEVVIEAGETTDLSLTLARFATVSGRIVDQDGAPLEGVEILVASGGDGRIEISRDDGDPQYFTDADGTFAAKAAAGGRVLVAQAPGVPMPIVIEPFVVEGGEDVDLGELRKRDMEGMVMEEGPGPEDE